MTSRRKLGPDARDPEEWAASTVADLFEAQVARAPEAVALHFDGRSLTYAELDDAASGLAAALPEKACAGHLVGVHLDRGADLVIALLAVLKAGAGFVVVDGDDPPHRVQRILADADPVAVITTRALVVGDPMQRPTTVFADARRPVAATTHRAARGPDDLAYVFYTSGSTGEPKGVAIANRAVAHHIREVVRDHGLGRGDVVIPLASINHHPSVRETFCTLTAGATLHVLDGDETRTPLAVLRAMRSAGATALLSAVPSLLGPILDACEHLAAAGDEPPDLRLVISCAERLAVRDAERAQRLFGCDVVNHFGPTECVMAAATHTYGPDDDGRSALLAGRPFAGAAVRVVSEGEDVEPGEVGELMVGGPGIALGYHGRPDATAEHFEPDPTGPSGALAHRTGDLVRMLPSGDLEFIGRADDQISVRGYRVEHGAVEAALMTHPGVAEAVVVAGESTAAGRLVACIVPTERPAPSHGELRRHVLATLPDHMVPSTRVVVDHLPLGANGKADRLAVAEIIRERLTDPVGPHARRGRHQPARGAVEHVLVSTFARLLGFASVAPDDDFFDFGGDSLGIVALIEEVRIAFGVELTMSQVLGSPTAAALGELIASATGATDRQIVPLRTGTGAPVFCLHGWPLDLLRFRALIPHLRGDRPVTGIVTQTLESGDPVLLSVEAMAEMVSERIVHLQPAGPLDVVGHSFGGLVAYEVGRRISATGREVRVVLVDSLHFRLAGRATVKPWQTTEAKGRLLIPFYLWARAQWGYHRLAWSERRGHPQTNRWTASNRANFAAGCRYRARPSGASAVVIASHSSVDRLGDRTLGWADLAEVIEAPGSHTSVLEPPGVALVAEQLR